MKLKYFKFEKDKSNRWYVVLPEWEGEHDELEMVCGADTMCDIIAQGENTIELGLTDEKIDNYQFKLTFDRKEEGGGWYFLDGDLFEFQVWLCHVTKFVFGYLPNIIYIR